MEVMNIMKFACSTKPLIDALNLGIVNQNISKFHQKSCLAQIKADRQVLQINLEAAYVFTEIMLKGSGDSDEPATVFVDCALLKSLVSTFDGVAVTTFEFTDSGLVLHSGSSKFNLPKMVDDDAGLELTSPGLPPEGAASIDITKDEWKFIKDYQMYAIAMSFIHPVYTRVYVGEGGDTIVGDFDNSLFTYSKKSKLGSTCLLSDTIINLFNSLPEGAKLTKLGRSYLISVQTDGYEYASEFTPVYESDEGVGEYNADVIIEMMNHGEDAIQLNLAAVNKFMNQAALLSTSTEDTIRLIVKSNEVALVDKNVDCKIPLAKASNYEFTIDFKTSLLKSVISNFDEEEINICPLSVEGEISGVVFWTKNMTAVLGGVDEQ